MIVFVYFIIFILFCFLKTLNFSPFYHFFKLLNLVTIGMGNHGKVGNGTSRTTMTPEVHPEPQKLSAKDWKPEGNLPRLSSFFLLSFIYSNSNTLLFLPLCFYMQSCYLGCKQKGSRSITQRLSSTGSMVVHLWNSKLSSSPLRTSSPSSRTPWASRKSATCSASPPLCVSYKYCSFSPS